jgi:hypothetical protein
MPTTVTVPTLVSPRRIGTIPRFELVPALLKGIQFRQSRRKVPDRERLAANTCDRGVLDVLERPLAPDEFPEILRVRIRGPIEEHHQLLGEFLEEGLEQLDRMLGGQLFFDREI